MLTYATFNTLKQTLMANLSDEQKKAQFFALDRQAQAAALKEVADAAGLNIEEKVLKAFLLVVLVKLRQIPAGTEKHAEERAALLGTVPGKWHKDHPPTDFWTLTDQNRTPSWFPEYQAVSLVAEQLSFEEAKQLPMVGYAFLNHFGIGGLEDTGDPRSLAFVPEGQSAFQDLTMQLLASGIPNALLVLHPGWHEGGTLLDELPPGVDGRSAAEIQAEQEAAEAARKAAERAEREAQRRDERLKAYKDEKADIFAVISRAQHGKLLAAIINLTFDELKAKIRAAEKNETKTSWLPADSGTLISEVQTYIYTKMLQEAGEGADTNELGEKAGKQAVHFVQQFILSQVAAKNPDWFRELQNGDLKIRPKPATKRAARKALSRPQRAIRNHISGDIEKYGLEEVCKGISAIFGLPELAEQLKNADLKLMPKFSQKEDEDSDSDNEDSDDKAEAPAAPPAPPAAPAAPPAPPAPPQGAQQAPPAPPAPPAAPGANPANTLI